jgi:hypothetical protein
MIETIMPKTKGKAKKRSKEAHQRGIKEGRELVPLMVESYFTHNLSNVICMQIVRSNNNRRPKTSISYQRNLPLYCRG